MEKLAIDSKMHHLRRDGPVEWDEFSATPEAAKLEIRFDAKRNVAEQSLRLRQQDVKQTWFVSLNGKRLGDLRIDENDMILYFAIPPGTLVEGLNQFVVSQDERSKVPDDIRVGEIELDPRPLTTVLGEATLDISVHDRETNELTPARITILSERGALQSTGARSDHHLAVRPGIVYTSDGRVLIGLPTGRYTIMAGRGFEYSLATESVQVAMGEEMKRSLTIRREVPTAGYVACDTHVHTLTHSGHGDATIEERMITLAGEGIELPIATDHNLHIDYEPTARALQVRKHFTPVIGNEVTTPVGHFNVFAVEPGARIPNAKMTEWNLLFDEIYATPGVKAVILNHARDLHSGVRPFGPALHCAIVGENVKGWNLRANAMEVLNSGATQTDVMRLFHDWMGMLNHGHMLTPVGASDSHDVGRHFVGQGRTYIRAQDSQPGEISVPEAVKNFVDGKVMVSYGLLAEMTVDHKFGSGELVTTPNETLHLDVRVLGPSWVQADLLVVYANGTKILEQRISNTDAAKRQLGVKWSGEWEIPRPRHDVHLVAIASGLGIDGLFWKTAKPYQPLSTTWEARTIGCSGAIWLDVDGDGRPTPAVVYAQRAIDRSTDLSSLLEQIAHFDQAVAAQAAYLWQKRGNSLSSRESQESLTKASPDVRTGFHAFLEAWRENERARVETGQ